MSSTLQNFQIISGRHLRWFAASFIPAGEALEDAGGDDDMNTFLKEDVSTIFLFFFQRAPCLCWQAGAETDSIKWLNASITIAVCQDWVEQVAEVKMLRKKSISTSVLWRTKNWLHSKNNRDFLWRIIEVFIHLWLFHGSADLPAGALFSLV